MVGVTGLSTMTACVGALVSASIVGVSLVPVMEMVMGLLVMPPCVSSTVAVYVSISVSPAPKKSNLLSGTSYDQATEPLLELLDDGVRVNDASTAATAASCCPVSVSVISMCWAFS